MRCFARLLPAVDTLAFFPVVEAIWDLQLDWWPPPSRLLRPVPPLPAPQPKSVQLALAKAALNGTDFTYTQNINPTNGGVFDVPADKHPLGPLRPITTTLNSRFTPARTQPAT